ncbi:nuclear transport factor 2 family protein [Actinoplanes sp. M2I2]|uniref:nuclear transport factor 2 family protein n=1 Tax=Actinoplanes sp. M2I2 TaxID=1734444 RepID=UPI002020BEE6|nr:nuclear transport factor 2 family protein [Actinoplanes sp. M2I2]
MSTENADLADLEKRRLRALVDADAATLEALHAPEFVLIHPGGGAWSRSTYLGGVRNGTIDYRRFEAVSPIEVIRDGGLAVLRYRSAIDIHVQGQPAGSLRCWHTDCYRATAGGTRWRAVWSQATEIQHPDPI